jgi:hypothetical protein
VTHLGNDPQAAQSYCLSTKAMAMFYREWGNSPVSRRSGYEHGENRQLNPKARHEWQLEEVLAGSARE